MEGKILETDVKQKLPALNSEDALLFSKVAGYVHRIDKQVFYFFILEVFSWMPPSHKHTKVLRHQFPNNFVIASPNTFRLGHFKRSMFLTAGEPF